MLYNLTERAANLHTIPSPKDETKKKKKNRPKPGGQLVELLLGVTLSGWCMGNRSHSFMCIKFGIYEIDLTA